jgi:hypothetical protein
MVANYISPGMMLSFVAGVIITCCIVFAVITELADETGRPTLTNFVLHINVFVIPLISVVAYVFLIWSAKIVAG